MTSPTPGSRPGTPNEKRLLPRPSSSLMKEHRAQSPAARDEEEKVSASKTNNGDWVTVTSKFHWVDLAGSERVRLKYPCILKYGSDL